MGFFAASVDSADTDVAQDFHMPPNPKTHNYDQFIQGTVTDSQTGDPVAGATVYVAGFGSQLSAVTRADGTYSIGSTWGMYPGTYPKVVVQGPGYLSISKPATVPVGDHTTVDFSIDRDWAMSSGGGAIADFNGPDFSGNGCGPGGAIDGSLGTGWGSTVGDDAGDPTGTFLAKHIVVKLPQAVDVSSFGVDPQATCGDSGSASTGDYTIEVSSNGTSWTTVADGTFHIADRGQLNEVVPSGPADGVQYVRFTIAGDQVEEVAAANGEPGTFADICGNPSTSGGYSGCQFADMSELAVFGTPAP
jgi:extracellular elastinolytic metalloproteinase